MDPFIGQIMMFGGNFAPRGWAMCNGQLLDISQNAALFSILGTTYGGDGRTTFGLPDLRGRLPMHFGQGPGLSNHNLGQKGGAETVTLNESQLPGHNHGMAGSTSAATSRSPAGAFPASAFVDGVRTAVETYGTSSDTTLNAGVITPSGGGQAHDNMPPFGVINFVIALQGIFPSRN